MIPAPQTRVQSLRGAEQQYGQEAFFPARIVQRLVKKIEPRASET